MEIVLLGIVIGCTSWLIANWRKVSQVLADEDLPVGGFLRKVARPETAFSPAEDCAIEAALGESNVNVASHTAVVPDDHAVSDHIELSALASLQPDETHTVRTDGEPETEDPFENLEPDDLQVLRGVGPAVERALNAAGVSTHARLAALTDEEIDELEKQESILTRIRRDALVKQAQELCGYGAAHR